MSLWVMVPLPRQDLHAFTGVAQLKHQSKQQELYLVHYLHAFTGVAQLKLVQNIPLGGNVGISTPSPAWPN